MENLIDVAPKTVQHIASSISESHKQMNENWFIQNKSVSWLQVIQIISIRVRKGLSLFLHSPLQCQSKIFPTSHHHSAKSILCMCAMSLQSCPALCEPMDRGAGSMGILWARILECVVMPFSGKYSWPRDQTHISYISCIGKQVLYHQRHLRIVKNVQGLTESELLLWLSW